MSGPPRGKPMRRRKFIALLAGAALLRAHTGLAQQSKKTYRIAILHPSRPAAEHDRKQQSQLLSCLFSKNSVASAISRDRTQ